jgi:hypothetical protein
MVIGKLQLGQDVLSVVAWPVSSLMKGPSRRDGGGGFLYRDRDATRH